MPWDITYDAEMDCLVMNITGPFDEVAVRQLLDAILKAYGEHPFRRVFNDMREAEVRISVAKLFEIPKLLVAAGLSPDIKRALLPPPGFVDAQFFETTSRNRGQKVRLFSDPEEARKWLLSSEDEPA